MYFKRESVDNVWWASSVCIRVCMFRAWKDGPTDERTDGWMNGGILLCSYATFARNEILFFSFTDYGICLWLKITPNVSSYRDMFENSSDFNVLKSDITLWVSPWFSRDWTGLTLSLPLSDQFQVSPATSPEMLHHTVWRTWLFIAYSDESWLYYQFSLHLSHGRIDFLNLGVIG